MTTYLDAGARFSRDQRHRYALWRVWNLNREGMTFVMLNPSTANWEVDDPTIRKCVGFAERAGCGRIDVVNLFAYRSTNPMMIRDSEGYVGEGNDTAIVLAVREMSPRVVVAWGANGQRFPARVAHVLRLIRDQGVKPLCLGITKHGHPQHPLMRSYSARLEPFPS